MPLFECSSCGVVDNTAMSGPHSGNNFWESRLDGAAPLCSLCYSGEWHDEFARQTVAEVDASRGNAPPVEYTRANNWRRRDATS